jgi:hypothetical protein
MRTLFGAGFRQNEPNYFGIDLLQNHELKHQTHGDIVMMGGGAILTEIILRILPVFISVSQMLLPGRARDRHHGLSHDLLRPSMGSGRLAYRLPSEERPWAKEQGKTARPSPACNGWLCHQSPRTGQGLVEPLHRSVGGRNHVKLERGT